MNDRQREIINYLLEVHSAKVEELSKHFKVSIETIRRDLKYLEEQQMLQRVHGGATLGAYRVRESSRETRQNKHVEEKLAVAKLARDFVNDGEALAINMGTSSLEVVKALSVKNNLTIITNALEIGMEAVKNETNKVYVVGGCLRRDGLGLSGSFSVDFLRNFHVDKALLSVGGISVTAGVTDYHVEEAAVTRAMLRIANKKIALMDYSKLAITGLNKICEVQDLDIVLADWHMPIKDQIAFRNAGVKVYTADKRKFYG